MRTLKLTEDEWIEVLLAVQFRIEEIAASGEDPSPALESAIAKLRK